WLLDLFYPPRCGGCDRRGTLMCSQCLASLRPPRAEANHVPGLSDLVSAGIFTGPLREAIHKLKYEGDCPLSKPLAALMADALKTSPAWPALETNPPVMIAVPLHREKERSRGFNQSALLVRELHYSTGWLSSSDLHRVTKTRPQVGLNMEERRKNVSGVFAWQGSAPAPERVLLVDDVFTTGATIGECVTALKKAGSRAVYVATVARADSAGPRAGG
ncbi:MAG: ComF family protein, partial [Chloroflexota bacterium]|nr:ComF family protein [Chloroflexota bacterium]